MQKILLPIVAVAIVVGAGSFFGGMKYAQSKIPTGGRNGGLSNLSPAERQARFQQFSAAGGMGGTRGNGGRGFAAGQIIAKDDKSVTIKMNDGGSKIIFLSGSTQIMKTAQGSRDDLTVGEQVVTNGTPNSDGSLNAQSIQIRPAMPSNSQ